MAGVWLWVRSEWRHRVTALLGLALLIAVAGGAVLTVAGGARRAGTAVDRWEAATNQANVEVELRAFETAAAIENSPTPSAADLADDIAAIPGVRGVSVTSSIGASPDPEGFFYASALGPQRGEAPVPRIVAGREPDFDDPDEVLVNDAALEAWGVDVGDTLTIETLAPHQWPQFLGLASGEPEGPVIDLRVVGVARALEDFADSPEPFFLVTPAFVTRWADEVVSVTGFAMVNADPDRLDEVGAALARVGHGLYQASPAVEDYRSRIDETIAVEVTALWVFTAAAGLAGLLIVVQALSRHVAQGSAERIVRSAIGLTDRQQCLGSVVAVAPALAGGVLGAVVIAIVASPLLPRGVARVAEVDPGIRVDAPLLLLGGALLASVLLVVATVVNVVSTARGKERAARTTRLDSVLTTLPTVPALGARLSVGQGRRSLSAVWAGVGAVAVGVAGTVAVGTVDRSVDHLLETPALYGAPWQLGAPLDPGEPAPLEALSADPDVVMVGTLDNPVSGLMTATGPDGSFSVEPFTYTVAMGSVPLVLDAGRAPGPGEVAAGEEVLDGLGATVGDRIQVEGHRGPVELTIVGRSINPGTDELDQGFYVAPETFAELLAECVPGDDDLRCQSMSIGVGVGLREGADVDAALARLQAIVPELAPTPRPSVVDSLAEIGSTPRWLGAFLALLGLGGLVHALTVGGRRSRRDLAVVRVLGLRPRQVVAVVAWGAALMAAVGAVIGVAAGLAAGRLVWQRVVDGIGALLHTEIPTSVVLVAPLGAIGAALVLSMVPGRRAAVMRAAEILRSE